MWPNPLETVDLVTFTEEILNGKLHFLCSDGAVRYGNRKNNLYKLFWHQLLLQRLQDTLFVKFQTQAYKYILKANNEDNKTLC